MKNLPKKLRSSLNIVQLKSNLMMLSIKLIDAMNSNRTGEIYSDYDLETMCYRNHDIKSASLDSNTSKRYTSSRYIYDAT